MPKLPLAQAPHSSQQGGDVNDVLEALLVRQRYRQAERSRLVKKPGVASLLLDSEDRPA